MRKFHKHLKVVCALSGGVDSAVATALLKKKGIEVIGVFLRFFSTYAPEAERRAELIAKILRIPFYVFNVEKEFRREVINYFLKAYEWGLTPNPCVVCNKKIKFGVFARKALLKFKANFIATGHYVRIIQRKEDGRWHLLKGKDKEKDQSYFLWSLTQTQLKHVLFPVGEYTKTEVKEIAKEFKLPIFELSESHEICFIRTTVNEFLKKHLRAKKGKIVDKKGKCLGYHSGLFLYTIGQRKGIGLGGGPYYVLEKDLRKNILVVTRDEKDLYKKELIAKNVNWISGILPNFPLRVKAKIRYKHSPASATVKEEGKRKVRVIFDSPQRAITPGQSVVFYKGDEILGGGIIC